MLKMPEITYNC